MPAVARGACSRQAGTNGSKARVRVVAAASCNLARQLMPATVTSSGRGPQVIAKLLRKSRDRKLLATHRQCSHSAGGRSRDPCGRPPDRRWKASKKGLPRLAGRFSKHLFSTTRHCLRGAGSESDLQFLAAATRPNDSGRSGVRHWPLAWTYREYFRPVWRARAKPASR